MELKTFVAETISQIVEGVAEAQERCKGRGALVNPRVAGNYVQRDELWAGDGSAPAQFVEFDVALTATEGTGTKGGIGVIVGAFTLGSSGQSQAERSASSRVKFSVPLVLPEGHRGE